MFIIFGVTTKKSTVATGTFSCPRCNCDRGYKHKKATRYFSLFFIPVIPLNDLGEYVECNTCRDTYYPRVLKQKTRAQVADIATIGIRHVATAMLKADGVVDVREKFAALDIVSRFSSTPYSLDDLENDIESLDRSKLTDNLEELGAILNDQGKDAIITAAVYLAWSDGHADATELEVVHEIGKALTMRSGHVDELTHRVLGDLQAAAADSDASAELN